MNPKVVNKVLLKLGKSFGKITVKRGSQHIFVGLNFEFNNDGKVKSSMKEYIKECIKVFGIENIKKH